jgi:ABC-type transport system substrate-binding protein
MRLVSVPSWSGTIANLNLNCPPFDDQRVRQALAWAVDREALVAAVYDDLGTVTPSWLAAHPAYPEALRAGYMRRNPAKAGQLLDEAGWRLPAGGRLRAKDGQPLKFRLIWFGPHRPVAEFLQAQWATLGAEVAVEGTTDPGFLNAKVAANDWEAFVEAWNMIGDPAAVLRRNLAPDGTANYTKFRDAELEGLLAGFDQLLDAEERRQQALRVNARQAALVPFVPLAVQNRLTAVSRRVRNYIPHYWSWGPFEVHPDLWVAA